MHGAVAKIPPKKVSKNKACLLWLEPEAVGVELDPELAHVLHGPVGEAHVHEDLA